MSLSSIAFTSHWKCTCGLITLPLLVTTVAPSGFACTCISSFGVTGQVPVLPLAGRLLDISSGSLVCVVVYGCRLGGGGSGPSTSGLIAFLVS